MGRRLDLFLLHWTDHREHRPACQCLRMFACEFRGDCISFRVQALVQASTACFIVGVGSSIFCHHHGLCIVHVHLNSSVCMVQTRCSDASQLLQALFHVLDTFMTFCECCLVAGIVAFGCAALATFPLLLVPTHKLIAPAAILEQWWFRCAWRLWRDCCDASLCYCVSVVYVVDFMWQMQRH